MKNGVPEDMAFRMSTVRRLAWIVALGESEGGRYDWHAQEWIKPKS